MVLVLGWTAFTSAQARQPVDDVRRGAPAADRPRVRRAAVDSQRRRRPRTTSSATPTCCATLFLKRGFAAEILETGGNPLVFAELRCARAPAARSSSTRTTTASRSIPRLEPGQPVHADHARSAGMEDGAQEIANFLSLTSFPPEARLYARSASDDKAPIIALLAAVDALSVGQPAADVERESHSRRRRGSRDRRASPRRWAAIATGTGPT